MNKEFIIVSNNETVLEKYPNSIKVEGKYLDVLLKARDLIHQGYGLISHPLPASIRMYYSPVRSIIINKNFSEDSVLTIENSIENYKKTMGIRKPDEKNLADYEKIDHTLLEAAVEEYESIGN